MPTEIQVRKFVFSDPKENSNKFWNVHMYDDYTWRAHYGRVGTAGSWADLKGIGTLKSKIAEKQRKGYVEIQQASKDEKHVLSTPIGLVSLSAVRKAFVISERICSLSSYNSPGADTLHAEYMKLIPINIGMRSDNWVIHRKIKNRHHILKDLIEAADANESDALLGSLVDKFFAEIDGD